MAEQLEALALAGGYGFSSSERVGFVFLGLASKYWSGMSNQFYGIKSSLFQSV